MDVHIYPSLKRPLLHRQSVKRYGTTSIAIQSTTRADLNDLVFDCIRFVRHCRKRRFFVLNNFFFSEI